MVKGIGTDLLYFATIEPQVRDWADPFVRKTYTPAERELINQRDNRLACYATRFAGKEAVFKALGVDGDALRLNEIEILESEVGAPTVTLYGAAAEIAKERGISEVLLSLSYERDCCIAYALAQ